MGRSVSRFGKRKERTRRGDGEIAGNVVESKRLSTFIDYATAASFAIGFSETALAIEDSSNGIWRCHRIASPCLI